MVRDGGDRHGINHRLRAEARRPGSRLAQVRSVGLGVKRAKRYGAFMAADVGDGDSIRSSVRELARANDEIKLILTGIIDFDAGAVTDEPQFTLDEARSVVETAHAAGRKVMTHCSGPKGLAIAAGSRGRLDRAWLLHGSRHAGADARQGPGLDTDLLPGAFPVGPSRGGRLVGTDGRQPAPHPRFARRSLAAGAPHGRAPAAGHRRRQHGREAWRGGVRGDRTLSGSGTAVGGRAAGGHVGAAAALRRSRTAAGRRCKLSRPFNWQRPRSTMYRCCAGRSESGRPRCAPRNLRATEGTPMYSVRLWSVRHARGLRRLYVFFSRLAPALAPLVRWLGAARTEAVLQPIERAAKGFMFDCRECGQCVLSATGMACPMNCPKQMRNGPCGGVRADGNLRSRSADALRLDRSDRGHQTHRSRPPGPSDAATGRHRYPQCAAAPPGSGSSRAIRRPRFSRPLANA